MPPARYGPGYNYSNQILTLNHKLPVIYHVSPDVHFQYHIMKTAKDYTNYLNPGQTTVGSSDFPLYYLKKKIQSACPATFSKSDYFSFSGGLHIEQTSYNVHGDLIKGTSLVDIVKQSELSVIGLQTAVADVNDIKNNCYIIQVLATCLYTLLQEAYIASSSE